MINREIKSNVVKVINTENKGLTEMTLDEAIALAELTNEDLVCLNDKDDIPVCRICDYNKFIYEKQKKEKENRKKQRLSSQDIKEIQIGDAIAEHDLKVKAKNIERLLKEGNKVRLVIKYKGRSIRQISSGPQKLQELANIVTVEYKIDKIPKIEGNRVNMIISPIK